MNADERRWEKEEGGYRRLPVADSKVDQVFEGSPYRVGVDSGAEVQEAVGFPDAPLGSGLDVEQEGALRMMRSERVQQIGDAAHNHGQFVVEIVGGRGGNGARAVGFVELFHGPILLPQCARALRQKSVSN